MFCEYVHWDGCVCHPLDRPRCLTACNPVFADRLRLLLQSELAQDLIAWDFSAFPRTLPTSSISNPGAGTFNNWCVNQDHQKPKTPPR